MTQDPNMHYMEIRESELRSSLVALGPWLLTINAYNSTAALSRPHYLPRRKHLTSTAQGFPVDVRIYFDFCGGDFTVDLYVGINSSDYRSSTTPYELVDKRLADFSAAGDPQSALNVERWVTTLNPELNRYMSFSDRDSITSQIVGDVVRAFIEPELNPPANEETESDSDTGKEDEDYEDDS